MFIHLFIHQICFECSLVLGIFDGQDQRGHCPCGRYLMGETEANRMNEISDRSCDAWRKQSEERLRKWWESRFGQVVRESILGKAVWAERPAVGRMEGGRTTGHMERPKAAKGLVREWWGAVEPEHSYPWGWKERWVRWVTPRSYVAFWSLDFTKSINLGSGELWFAFLKGHFGCCVWNR